jgi:hypothetical protein
MKKILTIACIFAAFSASAQLLFRSEKTDAFNVVSYQSTLSEKNNIQYIELSIASIGAANKVLIFTAVVDIGELKGWFIADATGNKAMKFNSPMDIFNYLHAQGWEFVSVVEDTRSIAIWEKVLVDTNTVRTEKTYIFKRRK